MSKDNFSLLTKDERIEISINELIKLANTLNKCPTVAEFELVQHEGFCRRILERHLKLKYNNICKKYIPEFPVNVDLDLTKEDIINKIISLIDKLGRVPYQNELRSYGINYSYNLFRNKFGMTYNQFIESIDLVAPGSSTCFRSEDVLLNEFYELFKKLKRIPYYREFSENKIASYRTYLKYFNSVQDMCKLLNINYKLYYKSSGAGRICFDELGNLCKSLVERDICNYLISNNIKFDKDTCYSELINGNYKLFDWKIYLNDKIYYVEYFGMYRRKSKNYINFKYSKRTKKKIKALYKNGCIDKCIFIFPYDIKNKTLDEIFSFLNN